jgi:hypothetical protein
MDTLLSRTRAALPASGGAVLAVATRVVAARPARKPLHPRGDVATGRIRRTGGDAATGVSWLDEPGNDDVLVRRSRAVGLSGPLPDIHGLAVRVPVGTQGGGVRHGDLLFASTGLGRWTRFVLTGSRDPAGRPLTTLLPYRTTAGPLLLAALPQSEQHFELAYASPRGPWHRFAELVVDAPEHGAQQAAQNTARNTAQNGTTDALVSFDPLHNTVPGLENYDWVRRLREPAYATARRSR